MSATFLTPSPAPQADYDTMSSMLSYGREVLSQVVDENRRR
jgi:hypothetical protein